MSSYPYHIAIIGAGTSGLAAAVKLFEQGPNSISRPIKVSLFEHRRDAGGRTRSFIDEETGDTIDNGQHLLMGCYTSTLEYLHTIGTEHLLKKQSSLDLTFHFPEEDGVSVLQLPRFIPAPFHLFIGLLNNTMLHRYEKLAAMRFGLALMMFHYDKKIVNKSCSDLFRLAQQPLTLIKKLWAPIVIGMMNLPPEKASAEVFLNVMRIVFLHNRKYSAFLFPKVGLTDLLISPALKYLKRHQCTISTGEQVLSIKAGNNKIYLETKNERNIFDALIFAGSYHEVSCLPEEILKTIPQFSFSPITNAYFWTDKKIVDKPICGFIGTSLQWCFTKPSHFSTELLACTMSASDELIEKDNAKITEIFWNDLMRSFPESDAHLIRSVIIKEKRATPLLDAKLQSMRPKTRTVVPNLYLAGDLIQNGLPMTIEGSIRNGQKAAEEILATLKD